jgi:hypothetical protein
MKEDLAMAYLPDTEASARIAKVDGFIEYVSDRGARPVLCFYFHPWEFHKMPQGAIDYGEASVTPLPFITQNCGETACQHFEHLCIESISDRAIA